MSFVTTKRNKMEYFKRKFHISYASSDTIGTTKSRLKWLTHVAGLWAQERSYVPHFQLKRLLRTDYSRDNRHIRVNIIKDILNKRF